VCAIASITGKVGGELSRTLLAADKVIRAVVRYAKKRAHGLYVPCCLRCVLHPFAS
jgi:hypothetical protein